MCRITTETVLRANKMSMRHAKSGYLPSQSKDEITARTRFMGKEYTQRITIKDLRTSYGRALAASVR